MKRVGIIFEPGSGAEPASPVKKQAKAAHGKKPVNTRKSRDKPKEG